MKLNKHALAVLISTSCMVSPMIAQDASPAAPEVRPSTRLVLRVLADGTYRVGLTPVKPSDLPLALQVLAGLPQKPAVTVLADKDTSYGQVVALMAACRDAGLTDLVISTIPAKEDK